MNEDSIVADIRQRRQEHAARYGNDLAAICAALREQELKSARQLVNRPAKRVFSKTGS